MTCLQTPAPPVIAPPPLPRRGPALPLWLGGSGGVLAFAAPLLQSGRIPWPSCLFRKFTGVPCPTCGCTRSLAAWTRLDLGEALRFNPLFFALCLLLLGWLGVWCAERLTGRTWIEPWRVRAQSWPVWRTLAGLAALNWVYLVFTLPK